MDNKNMSQQIDDAFKRYVSDGDFERYIQDLKNMGILNIRYDLKDATETLHDEYGNSFVKQTSLPKISQFGDLKKPYEVKTMLNEFHFKQVGLDAFLKNIALADVHSIEFEFIKMMVTFLNSDDESLLREDIPDNIELNE